MITKHVAVIGAGYMGAGIAQVAAQAGLRVTLIDLTPAALSRAEDAMRNSLDRLERKGQIQESADTVMNRISFKLNLGDCANAGFIFESVFERIEIKHALYDELEKICSSKTIIASNTSTIPIGLLAEPMRHKNRLIGFHFFSPVPLNPLLELIPSEYTDADTLRQAEEMGKRLGKHALFVKKDIAGFLMNRMFAALAHEAIHIVECGAGSVEEVDRGMQMGYGMANGPLIIADLVGLDVCLHVMENLQCFDPEWRLPPSPLLQRMVAKGKLGRKSGKGFYIYDQFGKCLGVAEEYKD